MNRARDSRLQHVEVGGAPVVDADMRGIGSWLLERIDQSDAAVAFALHVAALDHLHDPDFLRALHQADIVYADGMSWVLLARLAGARNVKRCPTTDFGHLLVSDAKKRLDRRLRLGVLGGTAGLADRAGAALAAKHDIQVVFSSHGYFDTWEEQLASLRASDPDIVFVGLGCPTEHIWVARHSAKLPECLIVTCGGWFGFLVGAERRAPRWMQRFGLEWLFRLAQSPRRLARRYFGGGLKVVELAARVIWRRWRSQ